MATREENFMKEGILHVVAFDIPYPADYGGVQDIFYKLQQLAASDLTIHLHCFEYRDRKRARELESLCEAVFYYPRKGALSNISLLPYIVHSRQSPELLKNLINTPGSILFEGLHTTYYLGHKALQKHTKYVRLHNIEHQYYLNLARLEGTLWKKAYYFIESLKLKDYESKLKHADTLLAISYNDLAYYKSKFSKLSTKVLPPFFDSQIDILEGQGAYVLFHANLSVYDNAAAAEYLIRQVAPLLRLPLVIAGKNPSTALTKLCATAGIRCVADPSYTQMKGLVQQAHVNLLYSFMAEGSKLKYYNVLSQGRFCVANSHVAELGKDLSSVAVADMAQDLADQCNRFSMLSFEGTYVQERKEFLEELSSYLQRALHNALEI